MQVHTKKLIKKEKNMGFLTQLAVGLVIGLTLSIKPIKEIIKNKNNKGE